MKNFILIGLLALVGCRSDDDYLREREKNSARPVIEIEGCEYFLLYAYHSYTLCHKGNCKNPVHGSERRLKDELRQQ